MTEVFLRRLSRWQAETQREAVADVHVTAYQGAWGEQFHDREGFLRTFGDALQQPGFDMVVAGAGGGALVGCVYGFNVDRGGKWWRGFGEGIPWGVGELTASGQVFAIAELMVAPGHQSQGVATRLVEQLLTRTDAAVATVRVGAADEAARKAFTSWGWRRAGEQDDAVHTEFEAWMRTLRP